MPLALGPALWPNCLKIWQSSQVERTQFLRILTKLVLESDKIGPTSFSLLFPGPEVLLTMRGWLLLELCLGELSPILLKHWFFPFRHQYLITPLLKEVCQTIDQTVKRILPSPTLEPTHQFHTVDFVWIKNPYPFSRACLEGTLPSYSHCYICFESDWCHTRIHHTQSKRDTEGNDRWTVTQFSDLLKVGQIWEN